MAAGLHGRQLRGAEHVFGLWRFGYMQAHHIRLGQQLLQAGGLARIAQRQLGLDIRKHHTHAQLLGQHANLRANVAVADDAQRFAAHLVRVGCTLDPATPVQNGIFLGDATHQHDDLRQHQLGHASGVGKRSVEHRNAQAHGRIQIDLVGANAKAANGGQLRGFFQYGGRQLRARAKAHKMRALQCRQQLSAHQGFGMRHDVGVAALLQHFHRRRVYAFKQHGFEVIFLRGNISGSWSHSGPS